MTQASPWMSRLAAPCRRNGFVILWAVRSPPAAPHPVSRRRSCLRLHVSRLHIGWTFTLLTRQHHGRTHPDEPVEQVDGLVCQIGAQVERNGDQGGVAALAFVAGDMLRRGTAGFAGKRSKTGLLHAMPAGGIDADCADMVHTLDQAKHRARFCRFRHLAQPDEPTLAAFRPALRQRIQPPPLLGRQPAGQPTLELSSCLKAEIDTEAFEAPGWWDDGGAAGIPP